MSLGVVILERNATRFFCQVCTGQFTNPHRSLDITIIFLHNVIVPNKSLSFANRSWVGHTNETTPIEATDQNHLKKNETNHSPIVAGIMMTIPQTFPQVNTNAATLMTTLHETIGNE